MLTSLLTAKWGYIDRSGKVVIPTQFAWMSGFTSQTGYTLVLTGDEKFGFIDRNGKLIFSLTLAAEPFDDESSLAPAHFPERGWCFIHQDETITEMIDGKSIGYTRWRRCSGRNPLRSVALALASRAMNPVSIRRVVLCRYGEIFLKGENRRYFERKLVENMRRTVKPLGARVERLHGRILVWPAEIEGDADAQDACEGRLLGALSRVFGLTSISPVRLVERDLAAITEAAQVELRAALAEGRPRSFKVETRRADKRFHPASPEVSRLVGGALHQETGLAVDVHRPELVVGIEVGFEHAFVYARTLPGPGGLPVGCTGEVDLLLSGGIDSPVAGWMALKRGCHLAATYFHSFPYTGDKTRDKVARLARKLAAWQGPTLLRVVPFTEVQKALRDAGDPRLAVVLYRRMMVRVAEALARQRRAQALVTGEALAQVASQTLENLAVIGEVARLPMLRPLIGHDKQETIAIARRIDTFELSIEPYEDCCSLFVPDHPATKAKLGEVRAAEGRVDVDGLVAACVAGTESVICEP